MKADPLTAPTKNWRFSASFNSFVVAQIFVLRINPDSYRDGKNRHLRQARNRYLIKNVHAGNESRAKLH